MSTKGQGHYLTFDVFYRKIRFVTCIYMGKSLDNRHFWKLLKTKGIYWTLWVPKVQEDMLAPEVTVTILSFLLLSNDFRIISALRWATQVWFHMGRQKDSPGTTMYQYVWAFYYKDWMNSNTEKKWLNEYDVYYFMTVSNVIDGTV